MNKFITLMAMLTCTASMMAQDGMQILNDIMGDQPVCVTNYGPVISGFEGQIYTNTINIASNTAKISTNVTEMARLKRQEQYGDSLIFPSPESDFIFDGNGTITGYTGAGGNIVIPYEINGVPVTGIGVDAFEDNMTITQLRTPLSLLVIDDGAFSGCGNMLEGFLTGVEVFGEYAFQDCEVLRRIDTPKANLINGSAFDGATDLTSIYYYEGPPSILGEFDPLTPIVNYVKNTTDANWSSTLGNKLVVRVTVYAGDLRSSNVYAEQIYKDNIPVATTTDLNTAITGVEDLITSPSLDQFQITWAPAIIINTANTSCQRLELSGDTVLGVAPSSISESQQISLELDTNGYAVSAFGATPPVLGFGNLTFSGIMYLEFLSPKGETEWQALEIVTEFK